MRQTITTNANISVSKKITKAKITKHDMLDLSFEEVVTITEIVDGVEKVKTLTGNYTREGKNIVHDDVKKAFNFLRSHLAILCDQVEAQNKTFYELDDNEDSLERYKVNSYSIGGSGEHEGVTLSGSRTGKTGILNLNTQFTKYEGGDNEETYDHSIELRGIINHCNEEALLYIDGKIAPDAQMSLDFEAADNDLGGEEFE